MRRARIPSVCSACATLSFANVGLLWIDISLSTKKLQAVPMDNLRATRKVAIGYMLAYAIVGCTLAVLMANQTFPYYYYFIALNMFTAVLTVTTFLVGRFWLRALVRGVLGSDTGLADSAAAAMLLKLRSIERTAFRVSICVALFLVGAAVYILFSVAQRFYEHWLAACFLHGAVAWGLGFIGMFIEDKLKARLAVSHSRQGGARHACG